MDLIYQVSQLEQSVTLKQMGVEQKSALYHVNVKDDDWRIHFSWGYEWNAALVTFPKYSAYTLAELLQMMTDPVCTPKWHVDIFYEDGVWQLMNVISKWVIGKYECKAWAAAARIIYLIENKHILVETLNKQLTASPRKAYLELLS